MTVEADAGAVPAAEATPIAAPQTEAPPAPAPTPTPEATQEDATRDPLEAIWDKHNPPRASNGKFASRDPAPEPATEEPTQELTPETPASDAVETGETENTDQPEEETSTEPASPAIDAPHSWSAEMKAKWSELPPDVQKYVQDRESDAHKRITQQGAIVKAIEPFAQVLGEYQEDFKQHGVTPAQGISHLLARNRQFMSDPVAAIKDLAKIAGIDLTQLDEPSEPQPEQNPELLELRREIGELRSHMTAAQRAQHDANMNAAARDIQAFGHDKPYFNEPGVQPLMGVLMQSGRAKDLQEAYDMAVYADPALRQRIFEDQRKSEETKRAAEEAKRKQEAADEAKRKKAEAEKAAAEARKAASVNLRSGSGASPTAPKTMRETMEEVANRLMQS